MLWETEGLLARGCRYQTRFMPKGSSQVQPYSPTVNLIQLCVVRGLRMKHSFWKFRQHVFAVFFRVDNLSSVTFVNRNILLP